MASLGKAYDSAWAVHDVLMHTLMLFRAKFAQPNAPKPSPEDCQCIVNLSQEIDRWATRIAKHRERLRVPARKAEKRYKAKVRAARLGAPAPSHEEAELDVSGAEDAEAPGTMTDGDSLEAQSE